MEALEFVEQIAHRADSHLSAMLRGGLQFLGWTQDRYIAAQLLDNITGLLMGLAGEKVTAADLVVRPRRTPVKPQEAQTIAEFNPDRFMAWLMSAA